MILNNIILSNGSRYFGAGVDPNSEELAKIRQLPFRYWNSNLKLWLIPYSVENWSKLNILFSDIKIKPDAITFNMDADFHKVIPKHKTTTIIPLCDTHEFALLQLKEQLILKRYSWNTVKTYVSSFREFLSFYPDVNCSELSREDIKQYMLYKINKLGISESTQNCLINAIKFYYEKVEQRERFTLYDLRPKPSAQLPSFLSKEQVAKIITTIKNEKHRLLIKLIYSAGLRLGEVTRLKIKDIKWDTNQILIECSKGKKDRLVTLAIKIRTDLEAYIATYKPDYYLFEGQDGGVYSPRSVQNVFKKALEDSKVKTHATIHTLRHSYATHMILGGTDIRVVQELLGHASIKTTEIYTHITDSMKAEIKSPLDSLDI